MLMLMFMLCEVVVVVVVVVVICVLTVMVAMSVKSQGLRSTRSNTLLSDSRWDLNSNELGKRATSAYISSPPSLHLDGRRRE